MSFELNSSIQELLQSIDKGTRAAVNLHCGKAELLDAVADRIGERLQPDTVILDVAAYTSFDELVRELIMQLLLRDDKPENCRVADTAIEELNIRLLRRHMSRLLNTFGSQGSWICLVLKNFDAAEGYWDDSACAWVRELVDSGKIPTCLVLSSAPMSEVCDKPEGSSPLYNIFRSYSLEERE